MIKEHASYIGKFLNFLLLAQCNKLGSQNSKTGIFISNSGFFLLFYAILPDLEDLFQGVYHFFLKFKIKRVFFLWYLLKDTFKIMESTPDHFQNTIFYLQHICNLKIRYTYSFCVGTELPNYRSLLVKETVSSLLLMFVWFFPSFQTLFCLFHPGISST